MAILVVDDSVDSRLLIQRFLQQEGHRDFLMAGTAAEALSQLGADGAGRGRDRYVDRILRRG